MKKILLIALSLIGCLAVSSATNRTPDHNMTCPTVDVPDVVTVCVVTSNVTLLPVETVIVVTGVTGVTGVETGIVVNVARTSDTERRIDRVERYGTNKNTRYSNKNKSNRKRLHKRPGWRNQTT